MSGALTLDPSGDTVPDTQTLATRAFPMQIFKAKSAVFRVKSGIRFETQNNRGALPLHCSSVCKGKKRQRFTICCNFYVETVIPP